MLPLSNNRFIIGMWPHGITIRKLSRRRAARSTTVYYQNPQEPGEATWRNSLANLERWLAESAPRDSHGSLVLSNHYTRFMVLPWSRGLTDSEWLSLANAQVGLMWSNSSGWAIRLDRMHFSSSRFTCAIDLELSTQLSTLQQRTGFRLGSIEPHFTVHFNELAKDIGSKPALIVVAEQRNVTIGAVNIGEWCHVRTLHLDRTESADISKVVERERLLLGLPPETAIVYGHTADIEFPQSVPS